MTTSVNTDAKHPDIQQENSDFPVDVKVTFNSVRELELVRDDLDGPDGTDMRAQTQRRFTLSSACPKWDDLSSLVRERFQLSQHFDLALSYVDEDGDQVTISSDPELAAAWPSVTEDDIRDLDSLPPVRFTVVELYHPRPEHGHPHAKRHRHHESRHHPKPPRDHPDGQSPGIGAADVHEDIKHFIDAVKVNVSGNKEVREAFDNVMKHAGPHCGGKPKKPDDGDKDGDKKRNKDKKDHDKEKPVPGEKATEGFQVDEDAREAERELLPSFEALTLAALDGAIDGDDDKDKKERPRIDGLTGGIVAAILTPAFMGPPPPHPPPPPHLPGHPHMPGGPGHPRGQFPHPPPPSPPSPPHHGGARRGPAPPHFPPPPPPHHAPGRPGAPKHPGHPGCHPGGRMPPPPPPPPPPHYFHGSAPADFEYSPLVADDPLDQDADYAYRRRHVHGFRGRTSERVGMEPGFFAPFPFHPYGGRSFFRPGGYAYPAQQGGFPQPSHFGPPPPPAHGFSSDAQAEEESDSGITDASSATSSIESGDDSDSSTDSEIEDMTRGFRDMYPPHPHGPHFDHRRRRPSAGGPGRRPRHAPYPPRCTPAPPSPPPPMHHGGGGRHGPFRRHGGGRYGMPPTPPPPMHFPGHGPEGYHRRGRGPHNGRGMPQMPPRHHPHGSHGPHGPHGMPVPPPPHHSHPVPPPPPPHRRHGGRRHGPPGRPEPGMPPEMEDLHPYPYMPYGRYGGRF